MQMIIFFIFIREDLCSFWILNLLSAFSQREKNEEERKRFFSDF